MKPSINDLYSDVRSGLKFKMAKCKDVRTRATKKNPYHAGFFPPHTYNKDKPLEWADLLCDIIERRADIMFPDKNVKVYLSLGYHKKAGTLDYRFFFKDVTS